MAVPPAGTIGGVTATSWGRAVPGGSRTGGSPPCAARCKGGAASPVAARFPRALAPAPPSEPAAASPASHVASRGVTRRTARGALRAPLKTY
jgi:hypothetical protein